MGARLQEIVNDLTNQLQEEQRQTPGQLNIGYTRRYPFLEVTTLLQWVLPLLVDLSTIIPLHQRRRIAASS